MCKHLRLSCYVITLLFLPWSVGASSLKVGITVEPPFVLKNKAGIYEGVSISIWEAVAKKTKLKFQYRQFKNNQNIIKAYLQGDIDVIAAPISVTHRLIKQLQFSRPYFINKIGILFLEKDGEVWSVFKKIIKSTFIPYALIFFTITLLFGVIIAALEYYWDRKNIWYEHVIYGLLNALHALLSLGYIYYPKSKILLFLCTIWLFIGLVFTAIFTATITSSILISHTDLNLNIQNTFNEKHQHVAVKKYSPLVEVFQRNHIKMTYINNFDEGIALLKQSKVDAIASNYISIKYDFKNYLGNYNLQEFIIGTNELAFVIKDKMVLKKVNEALLELQEKNEIYKHCETYISEDAYLCLI